MRKFVAAILLSICIDVCHAENISIKEILAYEGTIGESSIFMTLSENNGDIVGGYHYTKYGIAIPLRGSIKNNKVTLTEKTALGDAAITADINKISMQGIWKNGKNHHNFHASARSKSYTKLISHIDSSSINGRTNIIITFADNRSQTFEVELLTDTLSIVFEDYNFDGFPDLRILESSIGANSSYIAWTYNPDKKIFEYSKEISMLSNPKVLHSEKAILSLSRDGCCSYIASKLIGNEKHSATFEYEQLMGAEHINDDEAKKVISNPINQKYFEKKYVTPMGPDGL